MLLGEDDLFGIIFILMLGAKHTAFLLDRRCVAGSLVVSLLLGLLDLLLVLGVVPRFDGWVSMNAAHAATRRPGMPLLVAGAGVIEGEDSCCWE